MSSIKEEIDFIKQELSHYRDEWGWKVAVQISKIPESTIITYGNLADWTNNEHGLNINARNVANVRRIIYRLIRPNYDDFKMPLHRIIKKDDIFGRADSKITQRENEEKRKKEGSWKKTTDFFKPII